MPRRIIFHIGQPKTGTTSLQRALASTRLSLQAQGVIYPIIALNKYNHHALSPGVFEYTFLHPSIRNGLGGGDDETVKRISHQQWKKIVTRCEDTDAETLLLSSETFFKTLSPKSGKYLAEQLEQIGYEELDIPAYVRNPAHRYLSVVQERLKTVSRIMPLEPLYAVETLRAYQSHFGSALRVRAYDRDNLDNGDVVEDFCNWTGLKLSKHENSDHNLNTSMSAEAISVLSRRPKRDLFGDLSKLKGNRRMLRVLTQLDNKFPNPTKPKLKPGAAEKIIRISSELPMLRDEFGISFKGIDYSKAGTLEYNDTAIEDLSEICEFDIDRRDLIEARLNEELSASS